MITGFDHSVLPDVGNPWGAFTGHPAERPSSTKIEICRHVSIEITIFRTEYSNFLLCVSALLSPIGQKKKIFSWKFFQMTYLYCREENILYFRIKEHGRNNKTSSHVFCLEYKEDKHMMIKSRLRL